MNIFINKHKEILSKETDRSISSHFTWGEGNVETETVTTTYHAQIIVDIFCDNIQLYRSLGGKENTVTEERMNGYPYDDLFDRIDGIEYTGLDLIRYGTPVIEFDDGIQRRRWTSWLCLENKNNVFGDEEFRFRIINRAKGQEGLSLVRHVIVPYTYETVEHYK